MATTGVTQPILVVDDTTLGANATADFSGLFTATVGNDVPGSGTTYALAVTAGASGIIDVATGEVVTLSLTAGGVVEGRIATGNALVFTVTVDGSGNVTLDQIRAVQHNDPLDAFETNASGSAATLSADGLIRLVATITDQDGDKASASVDIGSNL